MGGGLRPAEGAAASEAVCEDTIGWENNRGKSCTDYTTWCADGLFRVGSEWAAGEVFNFPEQNCCVCGKGSLKASASLASTAIFSLHANKVCVNADQELKALTVDSCEAQCERVHCGCFFFHRGVCSIAEVFAGVEPTSKGYVAHVRIGVSNARTQQTARSPGGQCIPARLTGTPPSFYLYNGPEFDWGERLTRCFENAHGIEPWMLAVNDSAHERDGAPPPQLAHGLWLYQALRMHPARVVRPEQAALFVVPAYGSLSEAVMLCDGTNHLQRMGAAAAALRSSKWWASAPSRHIILASTLPEDRNALGALGEEAAKGGAVALCADTKHCARGFQHRVVIPPLPLAPLATSRVHEQTAKQSCGASASRRRSFSLFFRGPHAHSHDAQELRARLWGLRGIPGASIKFTRGGASTLESSTRSWLTAHGWTSDVRVPFNALSYAYTVLHSDFCVVIRGDGQNAGRLLVDAVAAGCVPLIIGDKTVLPFRRKLGGLLPYSDFSIGVDEAEFLRFPAATVSRALDDAVPRLAKLRRALLGARESLLLGYGDAPIRYNMTLSYGADTILRSVGQHLCPRNPSSLRACVDPRSGSGATIFF